MSCFRAVSIVSDDEELLKLKVQSFKDDLLKNVARRIQQTYWPVVQRRGVALCVLGLFHLVTQMVQLESLVKRFGDRFEEWPR